MKQFVNEIIQLTPRLLAVVVVVAISALLGRVAGRGIQRFLSKGTLSSFQTTLINRLILWFFLILGIMLGMNILGLEKVFVSLLAGGGLFAIVLGFAFKEIGENLLAGIFLSFNRPFNIGDLIESEGLAGNVRDIAMRYTHIRTEDGRDVFIPNAQIFNRPLINYTKDGLRRFSLTIGIDYADDTSRACELLLTEIKKVYGVLGDPEPGVGVSAMLPQYVEILIVYWVDMFGKGDYRKDLRTRVVNGCRKVLRENGFTVSSDCASNVTIKAGDVIPFRNE